MNYGKVHRFLLRTIASRGVLSMVEAEEAVKKFSDNEVSIENLVNEINERIKPLKQQIKITNDELTDEKVVVFICMGHDEAAKSQNVFSATELEYFRLLLGEIMSIEARQVTGMLAMNLVNNLKTSSFNKTHGQKLLDTWCRMRYLDKDENNYALGVRAIHEFQTYLRQNMPDTIEECFLCKEIVFRGYNCPACAKAVHTRCLNRYLEKVQKWPCCKADFSQSQLDRLNAEGLTQTQVLDETSQQSAEYNTIVGNTQDLSQDVEMSQDLFPEISSDLMPEISQELLQEISQELIPEVSQRVTRKRKRN